MATSENIGGTGPAAEQQDIPASVEDEEKEIEMQYPSSAKVEKSFWGDEKFGDERIVRDVDGMIKYIGDDPVVRDHFGTKAVRVGDREVIRSHFGDRILRIGKTRVKGGYIKGLDRDDTSKGE